MFSREKDPQRAGRELKRAAMNGRLDHTLRLLNSGAPIDWSDEDGYTPLYCASMSGHIDVVRLLVERGAKVDLTNKSGRAPLHTASYRGLIDVVRLLVEGGAKFDLADGTRSTPLLVASMNGHIDVVRFLVERGAEVDLANENGSTPLSIARYKGHNEVVGLLEYAKRIRDCPVEQQRTPLEAERRRAAEERRQLEIGRKRLEEERRRAEGTAKLEEERRQWEIERNRKEEEDRRRAEELEEQLKRLEVERKRKEISGIELRMEDIEVGRKLVGGEDGAFGVVFEGRLHGATAVAVKKVRLEGFEEGKNPEEDFDHEVAQMRTALHPNVAMLMGVVKQPPEYWMVVELCENGSLFDVLHRKRIRLEPEQKRKVLVDVAKGMTYLHARRLVHRDIKSGNIFITGDWVAKVGDFGCSKTRAHSRASMKSFVGTSSYMAPEVMDPELAVNYTEKVDVYSFAILMWEVFEGKIPFGGLEEPAIVVAVFVRRQRPKFEHTPDAYRRVIERCWAHEPADRPSFRQVLDELLGVA